MTWCLFVSRYAEILCQAWSHHMATPRVVTPPFIYPSTASHHWSSLVLSNVLLVDIFVTKQSYVCIIIPFNCVHVYTAYCGGPVRFQCQTLLLLGANRNKPRCQGNHVVPSAI